MIKKQSDEHKINLLQPSVRDGERGSAIVIAVLIMGLLSVFVAVALSRTATEAMIMGNDAATSRSFNAAQASLEMMTRNFNKIYEGKINPIQADLTNIQSNAHVQNAWQAQFAGFTFNQQITPNNTAQIVTQNGVTIAGGPYEGLRAARDAWQLTTTATGPTGAQVQLTRTFFSNRLPIFQFGAYYERDMDFWPGPAMWMGGRVHTNGNLFLCGNSGLHFQNRVTAVGEVVHDRARNGGAMFYTDQVYVTDGAGGEARVTQGSVTNGPDVTGTDADQADGTVNAGWNAFRTRFNNNLVARAPRLRMPLQIGGSDPVEIIKRGRAGDNQILAASRYFNKASIRVSLDDSQARLPGGGGGRRLDGNADGLGTQTTADRGYRPRQMTGGYQATRFNGHRLYTGLNPDGITNRQTWIKVELVTPNAANPAAPTVVDVTEDFLSLGLTETAPFTLADGNLITAGDTRAILKMQRYTIPGPPIRVDDIHSTAGSVDRPTIVPLDPFFRPNLPAYAYYPTGQYSSLTDQNAAVSTGEALHLFPAGAYTANATIRFTGLPNQDRKIVPFPIKMYDVREGVFHDYLQAGGTATATVNAAWNTLYQTGAGATLSNSNVPMRGVMSVIDIDVANLRRFLDGNFDGMFPSATPLTAAAVPRDTGGVILYVSDRRGDRDADGVYDMENIYVSTATDNTPSGAAGLQAGEDTGGTGPGGLTPNGQLEADYEESCRYSDALPSDQAAVMDHRYFRRAVRLINGATLPGTATAGFTLATENGAYIQGDYNVDVAAGAVTAPVGGLPTPPTGYPAGSVPSSVVADAVTILSRAWNDGKSFRNPLRLNSPLGGFDGRIVPTASETSIRTALLMGTTKHSLLTNPNQGGGAGPNGGNLQNSDGGVNNFPRLIEDWNSAAGGPTRLNYLGSMVSLFYSRGSNGSYKGHNGPGTDVNTFLAPNRNWNFDTEFLDTLRNPPGAPFLQYVQITGFRQTNN